MRVRCLISEAAPAWEYRAGQSYEIPEADALVLIALGKFELADKRCPHCGGELGGVEETAAMGAAPERATMPRAARR